MVNLVPLTEGKPVLGGSAAEMVREDVAWTEEADAERVEVVRELDTAVVTAAPGRHCECQALL